MIVRLAARISDHKFPTEFLNETTFTYVDPHEYQKTKEEVDDMLSELNEALRPKDESEMMEKTNLNDDGEDTDTESQDDEEDTQEE